MKLADLQQALANPNTRKMLDLLSYTEGTMKNGYYTAFGGGRLQDLSDHPRYSMAFTQTDGKQNKTSAAGRYQFIKDTWDGVARQYGLRDFSPQNQDLGAVALLAQNGALPYVLKGDWGNAIARSGRTWASLPSSTYAQPTKSWQKVQAFLGGRIQMPQQPTQRQFVDLNALRQQYGQRKQAEVQQPTAQRQFVDLNALRKQQSNQQPMLSQERQFVDLNALRQQYAQG